MNMYDLYWAAGFLEGEGCFTSSSAITLSASQIEVEPLDRLRLIFGGKIILVKKENKRDIHVWYLSVGKSIEVMMTVYTIMSPRRKQQIEDAVSKWKIIRKSHNKFQRRLVNSWKYRQADFSDL